MCQPLHNPFSMEDYFFFGMVFTVDFCVCLKMWKTLTMRTQCFDIEHHSVPASQTIHILQRELCFLCKSFQRGFLCSVHHSPQLWPQWTMAPEGMSIKCQCGWVFWKSTAAGYFQKLVLMGIFKKLKVMFINLLKIVLVIWANAQIICVNFTASSGCYLILILIVITAQQELN